MLFQALRSPVSLLARQYGFQGCTVNSSTCIYSSFTHCAGLVRWLHQHASSDMETAGLDPRSPNGKAQSRRHGALDKGMSASPGRVLGPGLGRGEQTLKLPQPSSWMFQSPRSLPPSKRGEARRFKIAEATRTQHLAATCGGSVWSGGFLFYGF